MPVETRRRCPHYRWVDTADWQSTSGDIFQKLAGQQKIVVLPHFPLDFPGTGSIAVHVDGPLLGRRPPGSERRACGGASIAKGDADQRMKTMASKQPRKQAKSAEKSDVGEANQPARDRQASQSDRIVEGVNLATARMPDADRPRASTKRAVLIGMLERPGGASVAEIGHRLGWLPHTVRAAFTGLRHAGREVTRSKDVTGQSVYRLVPVEIAPDR